MQTREKLLAGEMFFNDRTVGGAAVVRAERENTGRGGIRNDAAFDPFDVVVVSVLEVHTGGHESAVVVVTCRASAFILIHHALHSGDKAFDVEVGRALIGSKLLFKQAVNTPLVQEVELAFSRCEFMGQSVHAGKKRFDIKDLREGINFFIG